MSKALLQNPEQQALFDRQGFLVVPFLSPEAVLELDRFFDEMHPQLNDQAGFVSSTYDQDPTYKRAVSDKIGAVFAPAYQALLQDYRSLGGAFLYKTPSQNSALSIHQDWTIVDEAQYVALNVWVPLVDITKKNGPLKILPGSHYRVLPTLRAPTMPFFFSGNESILEPLMTTIEVPAGYAVILNQSVVHGSPANESGHIRKAITAGVVSAAAPLHYYYQPPAARTLERYQQADDFLISFDDFFRNITTRPTFGTFLEKFDYQVPAFSPEDFRTLAQRMVGDAGFPVPPMRTSIWQRWQAFFQPKPTT
ncbi:MAG: hypothetical protein DA408_10605 [Bacteroidetes bacterium]|nr:MAG: hypothetical protein C7N36_11425 [Bacteroidota bacterium]PTM12404.1 MAG: hypothetical protein DA408_10605 [Bacteroidota bacterium]